METGVLEIGVRAIRLFHAERRPNGRLVIRLVATEPTSLDATLETSGAISRQGLGEAFASIDRLVTRARHLTDGGYVAAFAPHALGGASNAERLARDAQRRLGIPITLVSPEDCGRLAYLGACAEFVPSGRPFGIVHLGDGGIDLAAGKGYACELTESLPLGMARLHRAYGSTISGVLHADSSALFSLIRLCGGPACRKLLAWGEPELVIGSENATALRDVANAMGYLDGTDRLGRMALHALVPEVLSMPPESLADAGIAPEQAALVGTTAVVVDSLADLLGQREIHFTKVGLIEGAAIGTLDVLQASLERAERKATGTESRGGHNPLTFL